MYVLVRLFLVQKLAVFALCEFLKSRFQFSDCNLQVCGGVQQAVQDFSVGVVLSQNCKIYFAF